MALFKDLTKKELKHLKDEAGCTTLKTFKLTAATHVEMRKTSKTEPCYECKNIARKLGLEV